MTVMEDPFDAIQVHEHIYNAMSQVIDSLKGLRVLDCGAGYQNKQMWVNMVGASEMFFIPDLFWETNYVSMDIRPECGCEVTGDIEELDKYFKPEEFDVVLSFETLEHTLDPWKVLVQMNRVLKPDGFIFVSVPFTMGHHTPRDLWRWTEDGLRYMLLKCGFDVVKMIPLGGETGREWSWLAIGKKTPSGLLNSRLASFDQI